jgi:hypothetical protein
MEIKPQAYPPILRKYRSLLASLPINHPKRKAVEQDFYQQRAGYTGEQKLPYYVAFLPEKYFALYQLRIRNERNHYFQMDALLICPYFILIIEMKNYKGKLRLEPHYAQLIQIIEQEEKVYSCPIQQSRRQEMQLRSRLTSLGFPSIPIYSHVCIASDYSQLISEQPISGISHITKLPDVYEQLLTKNTRRWLSERKCQMLAEELKKADEAESADVMKKYQLTEADLVFRAACPDCKNENAFMKRSYAKWVCLQCGCREKASHLKLFYNYFSLVDEKITVRKAADLLQIKNDSTVRKLLYPCVKKAGGSTNKSIYQFDPAKFDLFLKEKEV